MKKLFEHINEHFAGNHKNIILEHASDGISISESYLRIGSEGYSELVEAYRNAFEANKYVPTDYSDIMILEKLQSGKKGMLKTDSGWKKVDIDIPSRNSTNPSEKSFKVYRATDKKHENGLPKVKTIKWGMNEKSGRSAVKNDDKDASKSFYARHKCSTVSDKNTPGWWACKAPELFGDKLKLAGGKTRW